MRPSTQLVAWLVLGLFAASGCRAPMPSFKLNNSTRIPPPPTGEVGATDPYYNGTPSQPPSTSAPATRQSKSGASRSVSSTDESQPEEWEASWTSPRNVGSGDDAQFENDRYSATIRRDQESSPSDSQVRQAGFESEVYTPGSTRRGGVKFNGMRVNDATGLLQVNTDFADEPASSQADASNRASGGWKSR